MSDARARLESYHALRAEFPDVAGVAFDVSDGLALALDDVLREQAEDRAALEFLQDWINWCSGSPDFNVGGSARVGWLGWLEAAKSHAAAIDRALEQ